MKILFLIVKRYERTTTYNLYSEKNNIEPSFFSKLLEQGLKDFDKKEIYSDPKIPMIETSLKSDRTITRAFLKKRKRK